MSLQQTFAWTAIALAAGGVADAASAQAVDPLAAGAVYLEADELLDERDAGRVVARGNVEARYGSRVVRADEVIYFPVDARVVANGNVVVIGDDGTVTYADTTELADDLSSGVADAFGARFGEQGKTGAALALRRDDGSNELVQAYYTACEPCNETGEGKTPTWRLRARRVLQDADDKMIYYRDAALEIKGVPILYTPFFAHADPTAGRRSGLLIPNFGESSRTGAFYEQPYYLVISPSQDLTIAPRLMSAANPLVSFEHRKRFYSGQTTVQASATHEQEFINSEEPKFGDDTFRGHIFAEGRFRISDEWSWGFAAERVSDDLYFRRYEIDDSDKARGLYRRSDQRLMSQAYVEHQTGDTYASAATLITQGLRAGDYDDALPFVAPLIDARASFEEPVAGGVVEARFSTAFLERSDGVDSRRMTAEVDWQRRIVSRQGLVVTPSTLARGDLYSIADTASPDDDGMRGRALGYVAVEAAYPLVRPSSVVDVIVEPVALLVAATEASDDDIIPNEDSQAFDLDRASVFDANRAPGYDAWEDGVRATVGARATALWDGGARATAFVGQSFRSDEATPFADGSGLEDDASDIVAAAGLQLPRRLTISSRARFDQASFDLERLEVSGTGAVGPLSATARYIDFDQRATAGGGPIEELQVGGRVRLTKNWSTFHTESFDLDADESRASSTGVVFDDECTRVEFVYKQDGTRDRAIDGGDSLRIQVTLSTLGSFSGG